MRRPRWLSSLQTKLIVGSLFVSLLPMSIAAELATKLVTDIVNVDIGNWLHGAAAYFLSSLRETQREAAGLARFERDSRVAGQETPQGTPAPAFLRMVQSLGYDLVMVYDSHQHIVYASAPVEDFHKISLDQESSLYRVRIGQQSRLMAAGVVQYPEKNDTYSILVGVWLDEAFIDSLKTIKSLDVRLYYRTNGVFNSVNFSAEKTEPIGLPTDALQALEAGAETYYDEGADADGTRVVYLPLRNNRGALVGAVSCGLKSTEIPDQWSLPANFFLAIFLTGALLSALAGLFVSRRLTRPLRLLSKGVRSVTAGDFRQRVPVQGHDEVAELAQVFNHMAEQLGQMHELETELRRRDRLSALGEVAMGIAHEVRNPLGTIKTSAELVRKNAQLSTSDAKLLGYVVEEVRRIDNLINEFLSFARPRLPVFAPTLIRAVIDRVAQFCEPELARHGIQLQVVDAAPGTIVHADAEHLFEACLNLVLNAIDAMKEGGGRLTVRLQASDSLLQIAFTDTGPGIDPDHLERIFNPFFTTKPEGTGLGLAKVYAVMQSHGGRVECHSAPGAGATFVLLLPISARSMLDGPYDPARR